MSRAAQVRPGTSGRALTVPGHILPICPVEALQKHLQAEAKGFNCNFFRQKQHTRGDFSDTLCHLQTLTPITWRNGAHGPVFGKGVFFFKHTNTVCYRNHPQQRLSDRLQHLTVSLECKSITQRWSREQWDSSGKNSLFQANQAHCVNCRDTILWLTIK